MGEKHIYGQLSSRITVEPLLSHWKNNKEILAEGQSFYSQAMLDRSLDNEGTIYLKNSLIDEMALSARSEVWIELESPAQNLDFQVNSSYSTVEFIPNPLLFDDWFTETRGGSFSAATLGAGIGGRLFLGTLDYEVPLYPISLNENQSHYQSNQISLIRANVGKTALAPKSYEYELKADSYAGIASISPDKVSGVTIDRITGLEVSTAITSFDTFYALQLAAGIINKDELLSPLQMIAADVDGNGAIQAKDALMINRFITSSAAGVNSRDGVGSWRFVASDYDLESFSLTAVPIIKDISSMRFEWPLRSEQALTGILIGDIDGSWVL